MCLAVVGDKEKVGVWTAWGYIRLELPASWSSAWQAGSIISRVPAPAFGVTRSSDSNIAIFRLARQEPEKA